MSRPNDEESEVSTLIGASLSADGTASATGFATGVPEADDVDPQDPDLEGGDDSAGAPDAPAGEGAP